MVKLAQPKDIIALTIEVPVTPMLAALVKEVDEALHSDTPDMAKVKEVLEGNAGLVFDALVKSDVRFEMTRRDTWVGELEMPKGAREQIVEQMVRTIERIPDPDKKPTQKKRKSK